MKYLLIGSGLLGLFLIVSGGLYLFAPQAGITVFGMSLGEDAILKVVGIRQLAFGLVIALLAIRGDRQPLAVVLFAGSIVPAVDGIVVWDAGPLTALRHWVAVPLCIGLGAGLWRGSRG